MLNIPSLTNFSFDDVLVYNNSEWCCIANFKQILTAKESGSGQEFKGHYALYHITLH
jgi:hypothetical protein